MSVSGLIADARSFTSDMADQASEAMDDAANSVRSVGFLSINPPTMYLPTPLSANLNLTAPTLEPIDFTPPDQPSAELTFQDIAAIDAGDAPVFTGTEPTTELPSTPAQLAGFFEAAPNVGDSITFPEPPAELLNPLIAAPSLTDHEVPEKPQVIIPAFDGERPVDTTVAPTDLETTLGNAYAQAAPEMITLVNGYVDDQLARMNPRYAEQMGRIETQLATYLAGGTALDATVEDAIYTRARSKNDAEARRVRDTLYAEAAGRGFTMPPGSLTSAVQQARQAGADNNAKAANEIAIAQAEMEQKNLQFAVTTSTGLRLGMVNASISYMQGLVTLNGQALEYGKAVLGAVIQTYDIARQVFMAKIEAYKADAMVFETKLRGAMASIELYKAEIDALEAMVQVDRSRVEVYRARIEALGALANVYRSQIEAVQGRVSLEKLKIDVFGAKVQAYTARVQAYSAEWQGYAAAVDGQTAKTRIYASQVDAYSAQVQAFRATVEAKSEEVQAIATTNDSRSRNFSAVWDGYKTAVQALGTVASTRLENQRQEIVAFQGQVSAAVAQAQVRSDHYRATVDTVIAEAKIKLEAQTASATSRREYGASIATLGTAMGEIYAGLGAAALSSMNSLAAEVLEE